MSAKILDSRSVQPLGSLSPETVDALLQGAIRLHENLFLPPFRRKKIMLSPLYVYIAFLIRIYPFTRIAIKYAGRWSEEIKKKYDDPFLIQIAEETGKDEKGHDELIVKDLAALGVSVDKAIQVIRSPATAVVIEQFKASVKSDPLNFFAWLYFGEKTGTKMLSPTFVNAAKSLLGPYRSRAMRFVTLHAATGLDTEHVLKREEWLKALPLEYQQKIIRTLYEIVTCHPLADWDLDPDVVSDFINRANLPEKLRAAS